MSELDKTIEELEAEVQSLDEAAQDAPVGAAKGESMDKVEGEVQEPQEPQKKSR